jgi:HD-like signal output (HDOD) protein/ActR/RegA family two-component response regulator
MCSLKRVLFVDDDADLLDAMKRALRRERRRWEMVFVQGGAQAIAEVRKAPYDVVVSDMRMPDVDGRAVLGVVKCERPSTVRILLTGHVSSEDEEMWGLLPALHQALAKPCALSRLCEMIEQSLTGLDVAGDATLRRIAGQVASLPTPAELLAQLSGMLASPTTDVDHIVELVASDPALSAKLLQLANTPYFGSGEIVTSVDRAARGLTTLQLRTLLDTAPRSTPTATTRWTMSVETIRQTSRYAAALAAAFTEPARRDEAFASGLLHQVGILAVGQVVAEQGDTIGATCGGGEAEPEHLAAAHEQLGARLLYMWGLPTGIVEAVRFHRDPGSAPERSRALASRVHVAAALARPTERDAVIDVESLDRAGCAHLVSAWRRIAASTLPATS